MNHVQSSKISISNTLYLVCFMHGRWLFYAGEEKFPDAERMLKEACDFFYALNRRGDNDALASGSTTKFMLRVRTCY